MTPNEVVNNVLTHFGVRGMKWGVRRKATVGPVEVVVSDRRKGFKTSGGKGFPAKSEAVRARRIGQIGKKSGLKALSDQELQEYARRIQLEQNVKRLQYADMNAGQKFVASLVGQTGKNTAQSVSNEIASQQVRKRLVKLGAMAAT